MDKFHITYDRIYVEDLLTRVGSSHTGATLLFLGTVREWTRGTRTLALSYTGYEPMALAELQRIGAGVRAQWPEADIAITHRLGDLHIGDISVAIAICCPHRSQAYAASRYAIEELKRTVPIWKRETYESGVEWALGCSHTEANETMPDRYARQTRFGPIGEHGQARLAEARIAIVGVGALGGAAANHLARAGVGFLRLIDRDVVQAANLSHQVLFNEHDAALGLPKAIAAKSYIEQINSSVQTEAHAVDLHAKNAEQLLCDVDLILDGTDNFPTRYLVNEVSQKHNIPWIYGGIVGDVGETCTFLPRHGPCFACLHPDPPPPGLLPTCETAGVIGPIVQLVATYQAVEALKLLVGDYASSRKTLLHVQLWPHSQREIVLPAEPACPVCAARHFPHLQGQVGDAVTLLCGRDTIQVRPHRPKNLDLVKLAKTLSPLGEVRLSAYFLRVRLGSYELSVFPDARVLVHGTSEERVARQLYAQYLGS